MAEKINSLNPPLFRRFQAPDIEELRREIGDELAKLVKARDGGDLTAELEISNSVGTGLYIAGDEAQAAPILERALEIAQQLSDKEAEIYALFNLATARQYLGDRNLAQSLFSKALALSHQTGIDKFDHYILHHQGRCFVEQGDIVDARRCFQEALLIRKKLNDPRVESSQAALNDLAAFGS
jgi:tetratricopeptide (TPR) repeat protein